MVMAKMKQFSIIQDFDFEMAAISLFLVSQRAVSLDNRELCYLCHAYYYDAHFKDFLK